MTWPVSPKEHSKDVKVFISKRRSSSEEAGYRRWKSQKLPEKDGGKCLIPLRMAVTSAGWVVVMLGLVWLWKTGHCCLLLESLFVSSHLAWWCQERNPLRDTWPLSLDWEGREIQPVTWHRNTWEKEAKQKNEHSCIWKYESFTQRCGWRWICQCWLSRSELLCANLQKRHKASTAHTEINHFQMQDLKCS